MLDQVLVLAAEAPRGALGGAPGVEELEDAEHHVRCVAQRHRDHRARAVAGHGVVALVEAEGHGGVEVVRVVDVHRLAADRAPAGDAPRADRHHEAREPRARMASRCLELVVLAEGEAERVALADVDRPRIGAHQGAGLAEDALHQQVEVVDAAQLDAQARQGVDLGVPSRGIAAERTARAGALGFLRLAERVAQLPLQPADRGDGVVALGTRVEGVRGLLDARPHLDRVGELLDVVGGARVEHGRAQLRLLRAAEDDHRDRRRLGPAAQAAQEIECRRAAAQVEVEEHHRRVDLERLDLGVADGLRGVEDDAPVRRDHRADAACERVVAGHEQRDRSRRRKGGLVLLGAGHGCDQATGGGAIPIPRSAFPVSRAAHARRMAPVGLEPTRRSRGRGF